MDDLKHTMTMYELLFDILQLKFGQDKRLHQHDLISMEVAHLFKIKELVWALKPEFQSVC